MGQPLVWKSPEIPAAFLNDEDLFWQVRAKVDELASEDTPSSSDTAMIFRRYQSASPAQRDAIDAAFVWMTGYTLASICAMVVTPEGKDFEATLEKWRKAGS
jgi:hypothetical protein